MRLILRVVPLLLLLSSLAQAQSRIDCSSMSSRILKQSVHYCVFIPAGYDAASRSSVRYPVLYFLHGLGNNEGENEPCRMVGHFSIDGRF